MCNTNFVKIPFGEKGKDCGFHMFNIHLIKYIEYYEVNEAIPRSNVVEQVPYYTAHYGDGRQTCTFNEEQGKLLIRYIEEV